ncbi:MAG: alpha/beta hydrolase [Microbacteriaceae bacterium]|nr:alpha/beta hydrolase [Microbacteriaceae bacterium]
MPLFDGISSTTVTTPKLKVNVLVRDSDAAYRSSIVLIHGNVSSSLFWQELMLALPKERRVIAIDLRGFGETETKPVDATRGVKDFSDDVYDTVRVLGLNEVHLVGWSMGAGVAMQYALDHPVASLTLESPVSPYGFGGTRLDGSRLTDDDAGTGGGGANPEFVASIKNHDAGADNPMGSRAVYASSYVAPGFESPHVDTWVESMLTTAIGDGNYPGDSHSSDSWPGFAAGEHGVLNTMTPRYFDVSGIVDLAEKPPILWVRGAQDAIVSDATFFDINYLGQVGVIPGWPGEDVAPAQPMVSQTRAVLDRYRQNGGAYRELVFENCGHSPHLEHADEFRAALLENIGSANSV